MSLVSDSMSKLYLHLARLAALLALAAGMAAGLSMPASAQVSQPRPFPEDARRGVVRHAFETMLTIDGTTVVMSAGGVIRNSDNLIIVPSAIPPQGAEAAFTLDANGQVTRVWLLNQQELAASPGRPAYSR